MMFHGLPDISLHPSKRGECKTRGPNTKSIVINSYEYYIATVGTQTQTYVGVPQYGPLSLLHNAWGPINCKTGFPYPTVRPLDDFQNPYIFKVTAIGLCVRGP
jgi:hypothetical protein